MLRLWHPLRDPYHCTFRMLTILRFYPGHSLSKQRLSLLDLLWLMPFLIEDINMSREEKKEARRIGFPKKKDSFVYLPSTQLLYRELQPIQNVALNSMAFRNLIDPEKFRTSTVELNLETLPQPLLHHVDERAATQKDQLDFLIGTIGSMPMDGADSLMRKLHLEHGGKLR
ncbi:MAG: hypothetical protein C0620_07740 [Desulfuromonas sp.]|nr:MAG: hypothetical protein C0620_07740 [Desulfuromonas sp.]